MTFADSADAVLAGADLLFTVQPPDVASVARLKQGAIVAGFLAPHAQAPLVRALKEKRITSFAMELVPRISRAQSMDALSSQAAVAGYKAVLLAASALDKFFPMLTTAAGTIRPATVLVIGAGVGGTAGDRDRAHGSAPSSRRMTCVPRRASRSARSARSSSRPA